ncbi:MAG: hypothetical protein ACOYMB_04550 [Patescibacteria group bacterium]
MQKDTFVFYFLGALILTLSGFFILSKNICSDFLNIISGSGSAYANEVPSVVRKEISFSEGFVRDGRFLNLRQDWLAPTSFSELTATSSDPKNKVDFKIGNQQLFRVEEKLKK